MCFFFFLVRLVFSFSLLCSRSALDHLCALKFDRISILIKECVLCGTHISYNLFGIVRHRSWFVPFISRLLICLLLPSIRFVLITSIYVKILGFVHRSSSLFFLSRECHFYFLFMHIIFCICNIMCVYAFLHRFYTVHMIDINAHARK